MKMNRLRGKDGRFPAKPKKKNKKNKKTMNPKERNKMEKGMNSAIDQTTRNLTADCPEMTLSDCNNNRITLNSGAVLNIIESESACFKHMIQNLLANSNLSDAQFRNMVRAIAG